MKTWTWRAWKIFNWRERDSNCQLSVPIHVHSDLMRSNLVCRNWRTTLHGKIANFEMKFQLFSSSVSLTSFHKVIGKLCVCTWQTAASTSERKMIFLWTWPWSFSLPSLMTISSYISIDDRHKWVFKVKAPRGFVSCVCGHTPEENVRTPEDARGSHDFIPFFRLTTCAIIWIWVTLVLWTVRGQEEGKIAEELKRRVIYVPDISLRGEFSMSRKKSESASLGLKFKMA